MGVASYSATPVGRYIGAHILGADRRNLNPTLGTAMQVPYSSIVHSHSVMVASGVFTELTYLRYSYQSL
jgi:hypothetical protein